MRPLYATGALAIAGALIAYAAWPQQYAMPPSSVTGAADPRVTQENIQTTICQKPVGAWSKYARPGVQVSERYKMSWLGSRSAKQFQLDDLIPVCAGGLPGPANWWLQPIAEARIKDRLEATLCRRVCAGEIPLAEAQRCIASNWVKCYETTMGVEP